MDICLKAKRKLETWPQTSTNSDTQLKPSVSITQFAGTPKASLHTQTDSVPGSSKTLPSNVQVSEDLRVPRKAATQVPWRRYTREGDLSYS
jgi:hypothetical protein